MERKKMKLTRTKLKQIIKEELGQSSEVVMDMTGREYPLEVLQANLDDEELATLLRSPNQYFVRLQNGTPTGIGPE